MDSTNDNMQDQSNMEIGGADLDELHIQRLRKLIITHPELVLNDSAVMQSLLEGHATDYGSNVLDLRSAFLERMEVRLGELEETHRIVVSTAYENLVGLNQIHRAALSIMAPARLTDFLHVLGIDIPRILSVSHMRLVLEGSPLEGPDPVRDEAGPVLVSLPEGGVNTYIDPDGIGDGRRVTLRPTDIDAGVVFGAAGSKVRSEALVRLEFGRGLRPGLLAFGSADPERFTPDQGGDLLDFFGGVIEQLMRKRLSGQS